VPEGLKIGYRVVGTVKAVKGECNAGHKVGDRFELSVHNTGGLCGSFYHTVFPYVIMLQFGGGFPAEWGNPDILMVDCIDKMNAVTIKLERIRE
jgi:uncharacterized repeat protein (TIGR04076 family)